jgi:hypothetical protein
MIGYRWGNVCYIINFRPGEYLLYSKVSRGRFTIYQLFRGGMFTKVCNVEGLLYDIGITKQLVTIFANRMDRRIWPFTLCIDPPALTMLTTDGFWKEEAWKCVELNKCSLIQVIWAPESHKPLVCCSPMWMLTILWHCGETVRICWDFTLWSPLTKPVLSPYSCCGLLTLRQAFEKCQILL